MKKVIIIGAGTIGLHTAYYLKREGFEVEVIEARSEQDDTGCSYINCGYMVPSHFLSMASPSMLKAGFKMMFSSKSPVGFNPMKNIGNAGWFLKFLGAANNKRMHAAAPLLFELNDLSNQLYKEIHAEHGWNNQYTRQGLLMVTSTAKGLHEEIEVAELGKEFGIHTEVYMGKELSDLEPNIELKAAGAVKYFSDAHLHPGLHMHALKSYLEEQGVVFHYNTSVSGFNVNNGAIKSAICGDKTFKADEFVIATGAVTGTIADKLNLKVPVIAGKGYSIDLDAKNLSMKHPAILVEDRIAITPLHTQVRIGSGMEFNGQLDQFQYKRIQNMLDATHRNIPSFPEVDAKKQKVWAGQRPLSPDGVPYIGRTTKLSNVLVAAGHAMMGMSLGPITGKLLTEEIAGQTPSVSSPLLSPDRYGA